MRCLLTAVLAAAMLDSPAAGATRNFGVTGFDRVRVEGPYTVRLTTGVAPFARATGNQTALDRISIAINGRTLLVRANRSGWGGYPGEQPGPVEITLGTHDLNAGALTGSGSLSISRAKGLTFDLSIQGSGSAAIDQADVDQLKIAITGSGNSTIAGRAGTLTAVVRGVSMLDATNLTVKDATIGAEGPATVKTHVTNAAKIDASGAATVTLGGRPACTVRLSGSATVSGCRSTQ